MDLDQILFTVRLIASGVIAIGWFSLYRLYRQGTILSGTSGLHASLLIFMGVGPIVFTFGDPPPERVSYDTLLTALIKPYSYFLLGYALAVGMGLFTSRARPRKPDINPVDVDTVPVSVFGGLALLGYTMSLFDFSTSGVGTIFPVLGTFLYPVIV